MPNPRLELDATLNNADFIKHANQIQVEMDKIKDASYGLGISTTALNKALKDQGDVTKKGTMSWTDFRSMYSTVLDVVRVGQQVWEETGQKFVDNAIKAGDMARAIGTTTEEASRIKEVADDVGISVDKLTASFRIAQKDGFSPTIDGLAKMSDEYLALAPGIERAQYLQDRFGKGGEEMGKLLDKGSKAIRENAAAMDKGLVVTQEAYEQARKYQISVDALSDSWDAFTYRVAPPLVDALTKVLQHTENHTRALEIMEEQGLSTYHAMGTVGYAAAYKLADAEREAAAASLISADAASGAANAFETEAEAAKRVADEAKEAEAAIRDMTKANQEHLDMIGDMTGDLDSHVEKLRDIRDANVELQDEKKLLISQGYTEESKAIQDVNAKIDENKQKYQEATDEFELNGRRRILSMLEQQLSIDGLDARETEYLLSKGLEWGVYSETAVREAQRAMAEVAALSAEIAAIPTEKTFTLKIQQLGKYDIGTQQYNNIAHPGRAVGGPVSAGMPYMVGERGPELMVPNQSGSIVPNNKLNSGGVVVNIMLDSATPDPERVAYNLGPAVKRVLRAEGII